MNKFRIHAGKRLLAVTLAFMLAFSGSVSYMDDSLLVWASETDQGTVEGNLDNYEWASDDDLLGDSLLSGSEESDEDTEDILGDDNVIDTGEVKGQAQDADDESEDDTADTAAEESEEEDGSTDSDDGIAIALLDDSGDVTTTAGPGSNETEYEEGHYYHIDIRVEGEFTYTYPNTTTSYAALEIDKEWTDTDSEEVDHTEDEVTVYLYDSEGKLLSTQTLNSDNNWTLTLSEEDYDFINSVAYITEGTIEGYSGTISSSQNDSEDSEDTDTETYTTTGTITVVSINSVTYTNESGGTSSLIVNLYEEQDSESTEYEQEFFYDNNNNYGGRRLSDLLTTSTITINLTYTYSYVDENGVTQTGTITADFVFSDLEDTNTCAYKDYKSTMAGYDAVISTEQLSSSITKTITTNTYTITNTPNTEITVYKEWDDNDDPYGVRPSSVTFTLYANGEYYKELTISASEWTGTFTDLPVYDSDGNKITYTVAETTPTGYTSSAGELIETEDGYSITFTNTPETTQVTVIKEWNDNDNEYSLRPDSIQVTLVGSNDSINETLNLSESTSWSKTVTGLPIYDSDGNAITYSLEEVTVNGYASGNAVLTGSAEEGFVLTITNTLETSLTVIKAWKGDEVYSSQTRPSSVTIYLYANGSSTGNFVTLTEDNNWSGSFENLAVYDSNGDKITYSVGEISVNGYDSAVSNVTGSVASGYEVTVTNTLKTTQVTVTKNWDDDEDKYGLRPENIEVTLTASGIELTGDNYTQTLNEDNNWSYTWTDLPVYNGAGEEITYTVTEATVTGYKTTYSDDGFTITNTLETTSVSVTKVWEDENDKYNLRPESIEVILTAEGIDLTEEDCTQTLNEDNNWSYTWEGLPVYNAEGVSITYKVQEVTVTGYTTTYSEDGLTIMNTLDTTVVSLTKVWVDADDQYGLRPEEITVTLYADGEEKDTQTLTKDDWSYTWEGLPKYNSGGNVITYTVQEATVTGYITTYSEDGLTITNTLDTTDVSVTKVWEDENDKYNLRPDSIKVTLTASGIELTGDEYTQTLNEGNSWSYTWEGLPVYNADGDVITYTVEEDEITGYTSVLYSSSSTGFTLTNTLKTVDIPVLKVWEDNDNAYGIRPDSIKVILLANGEETGDSLTLSEENNWSDAFTGLAEVNADGESITYTIKEVSVNGYTSVTEGSADNGFTITNTVQTTQVEVTKAWVNSGYEDEEGLRPDEIEVKLLADGEDTGKTLTLSDDNDWSGSFTCLLKYTKEGTAIVYTIKEVSVSGYSFVITGSASEGFLITNTLQTTTVSVNKVWEDADNKYALRPENITVTLKAEGIELEGEEYSQTLSEENSWSYTWEGLPVYNADGDEIIYTVTEDDITGYTSTLSGSSSLDFTLTNTLKTVDILVSKVWEDNDNAYGIRPESITVILLANEEETGNSLILSEENNWSGAFTGLAEVDADGDTIAYTIKEMSVNGYETAITVSDAGGYTITNTVQTMQVEVTKEWVNGGYEEEEELRPDEIVVKLLADGEETGKTLTLSDDNDWSGSFTCLLKYTKEETAIVYTIEEESVNGYTSNVTGSASEGFLITNTLETVQVPFEKVWDDDDDAYGIRPDSITVYLYAQSGENEKTLAGTMTLPDADTGAWSGTFENLPKYDADGNEITYTIEEVSVTGYTTNGPIENDAGDGYVITNTPILTKVSVTKIWDDHDDENGLRPESVTVYLYANGVIKDTCELSAENNWTYTFSDLPVYTKTEDGVAEITYTVSEQSVDGYTAVIEGSATEGFTITNSRDVTTQVQVQKIWDPEDDENIPGSVTVILYKKVSDENGEEEWEEIKSMTLTADNGWSGTFTDLPAYDDEDEAIVYSVREVSITGFKSVITGSASSGYTITNVSDITEVPVSKIWYDQEDENALRPESVTIHLYADDEDTGKTLTLTADNDWSGTFEGLQKYRDGSWDEIEYTLKEDTVTGYSSAITGSADTGYVVTNTLVTTSLPVSKIWVDESNAYGLRPESITVHLFADGADTGKTLVLTAENNWQGSFEDLPVYNKDGSERVYTVTEDAVSGYTNEVEEQESGGFVITNTLETVNIPVTKLWESTGLSYLDESDFRPGQVVVLLLADGEETDKTLALTAENGWSGTFSGLPKYHQDGTEVIYTVSEETVVGYLSEVSEDESGGFVISNTLDLMDIEVKKVWIDSDDENGLRAEEITVMLFADGIDTGLELTLSKESDWTGEFTGLPVWNTDGSAISYTLMEKSVTGYSSAITGSADTGYVVTNTLDTTSIPASKIWVDESDAYGLRPESITVHLFADGADTGKTLVLTAENNWQGSFEDLPVYNKDGSERVYTVTEDAVSGYTNEVEEQESGGFVITNTLETVNIPVTKLWESTGISYFDESDYRPGQVVVLLLADGEETDKTLVLTAENGWNGTFSGLPKYHQDGTEVSYSVTEIAVPGYSAEVDEDEAGGFTITNTLDLMDIVVEKVWNDSDNENGQRAEEITVMLFADGINTGLELTLSEESDWAGEFTGLPVWNTDGSAVTYTLMEKAVTGYSIWITGSASYGFTVTNSLITRDISVEKTWNDNSNAKGVRPGSVTIRLWADGEDTGKTLVLSSENSWYAQFTDLPRYDGEGNVISYTITEDTVSGYTTSISGSSTSGYVVCNTSEEEESSGGGGDDSSEDTSYTEETVITVVTEEEDDEYEDDEEDVTDIIKGQGTGDDSQLFFWGVVMLSALMALVVLACRRRKIR